MTTIFEGVHSLAKHQRTPMWKQCAVHPQSWAIYECDSCKNGARICLQCFNESHPDHSITLSSQTDENQYIDQDVHNELTNEDEGRKTDPSSPMNGYDSDVSSLVSTTFSSLPFPARDNYELLSFDLENREPKAFWIDNKPEEYLQQSCSMTQESSNDSAVFYDPSDGDFCDDSDSIRESEIASEERLDRVRTMPTVQGHSGVFPIKQSVVIDLLHKAVVDSPNGITTVETSATVDSLKASLCTSVAKPRVDSMSEGSSSEEYIEVPKTIMTDSRRWHHKRQKKV